MIALVLRIAYGCPEYKGPAIFHLFCKVPLVKNRLFPTKPLPLYKALMFVQFEQEVWRFVQFGQESCPAGEYLHSEQLWMLEKVSAALKNYSHYHPTNSTHFQKSTKKKKKSWGNTFG